MGLAEADAAIKEQRIENHLRGFGDTPGGGVGKLVWLADDELLEGIAFIQGGADVDAVIVGAAALRKASIAGRYSFLRWSRFHLAFGLDVDVDSFDCSVFVRP